MRVIRIFAGVFCGVLVLCSSLAVRAVPTLQLDIINGSYDNNSESVVTTDLNFTLVAYGNTSKLDLNNPDYNYFLSIALAPKQSETSPGPDFGSFDVDGTTYNINDLVFGTPSTSSGDQLAPHGIYDTYYMNLAFNFDPTKTRNSVNTQDNPGTDPASNPGDDLFYSLFNFDVSNLVLGYDLHFDLYSTRYVENDCLNGNGKLKPNCTPSSTTRLASFAPFSHDAEYRDPPRDVPEPASLALLGIGLLGLFLSARRRHSGI